MTDYRDAVVNAIVSAWVIEGRDPRLHREQQARLDREWPLLARALRQLAAVQPVQNHDHGDEAVPCPCSWCPWPTAGVC